MTSKRISKALLLTGCLLKTASVQAATTDHGLVGGRGVWPFFLYLGYLIFVGASFFTKQTEFYLWTLSRERSPVLYWGMMALLTALAILFGWSLWENAF